MIDFDAPYTLASAKERERRTALLYEPHIMPLVAHLKGVRKAMGSNYEMPSFDPLDGGIHARALFLLEAPGPKAVGSAFISRNNPDPTARNLCELLASAGIARKDTLIWNIVPWYVGDGEGRIRAVTPSDIGSALPHLKSLLELLPELRVIVLVGKKAQSAASEIRLMSEVPLVMTHHPSARVFNVWPEKRGEAERDFGRVAEILS
ncbi:MAG: uracil-DNA glycosylase [Armatimonas sp.]